MTVPCSPRKAAEDGAWIQVFGARRGTPTPALFVDRDGTVIAEHGHLHRPTDVRMIPGAGSVLAAANQRGVAVVMVTNQTGIGRGLFGWEDFSAVQNLIRAELARDGSWYDALLACSGLPEGMACKPDPAMIRRAATLLNLDLPASWIIGDHASDLEAAKNGGLAGGIHVRTGHGGHDGQRARSLALADSIYRVSAAESIADALAILPYLETGGPNHE